MTDIVARIRTRLQIESDKILLEEAAGVIQHLLEENATLKATNQKLQEKVPAAPVAKTKPKKTTASTLSMEL